MRSANRWVGIVGGAAFVLLGVLSMLAGQGLFGPPETLVFGVLAGNAAQGILHVLVGAALAIAGLSRVRASAVVNGVVGGVLLVLGLAGLFLVGTEANLLALSVADNAVHFGAAAVLLAAGLGADRPSAGTPPGGA